MATEKIRVFKGVTELPSNDATYTKSDDQVVDRAEMKIEANSNVETTSVIDFKDAAATTTVFTAKIVNIKKESLWKIKMLGRGYELNNFRVEQVYENRSPEYIVQDIIDNQSANLTYASTETSGVTISKYIAKAYAIDVIKDMMVLLGWQIRIDTSDNFYFEPRGNIDNGKTFTYGGTSGDINITFWEEDDSKKFNKVKIIGQTVQFRTQDTDTGDGSTTEYTLTNKPNGTVKVFVDGVEKEGGADGENDFAVEPENKKVIFAVAPGNTLALIFEYSYDLPIVIIDQDDGSINADEEIFKEVPAPFIDTFSDARRYARELLAVHSDGELRAKGVVSGFDFDRDVGELITLVDNKRSRTEQLVIRKIIYKLNDNKTEFEFGTREFVFFDWQAEVQDRIKLIERRIQEEQDVVFARTLKHDMSVTMKVQQNSEFDNPVDSFILGHETLGRLRPDLNFEVDCSDLATAHHGDWNGAGIGGSQYDFVNVFTDLVSYWKLNEAEGTSVVDSKGSNDGTNTSATIVDGKFGYCLEFDGSTSFVDLGDDTDFEFAGGDFTLEAWVNPDVINVAQAIFSKWNISGNQREYLFQINSSGKLELMTSSDGTAESTATATTALTASTWQHVIVTKTGTTATFYIDGASDGSGTVDNVINTGTAKAYIGASENNGASPDDVFDGKIDNVRAYSNDLGSEKILELYNISGRENFRLSHGVFNGTDNYIDTADHSDLDGGDIFSVSFAIKMSSLPGTLTWIMNKYDGTDGWGVRINASNKVELFYDDSVDGEITFDTDQVLSTGKFEHIAFTKNGTSLKAYVGGTETNSTTAGSATIGTNVSDFEVGRYSTNFFGDRLDEVRVYTDELISTEVSDINNKINHTDNLVLWWSMDNPNLGDRIQTKREWTIGA